MTEMQKKTLDALRTVFARLNDAEMRQLVAYGEGMAVMKEATSEREKGGVA
ncbi:MAG: hypothetical protein HFF09_07865 [Oscillospiraceae bacterium]|nr:hypothetical protein [Oscillospiraceae bacterium]